MPKKAAATDRFVDIRRRLTSISTGPGVYRWLDSEGGVLYVGKAKNLRNRLRSYVQVAGPKRSAWTDILVSHIVDFDVTVTNTELEALLLETNLIKELKPKYNIMMKDDKNYVYLRISIQDAYPRIDIVRRMESDGAQYFGPQTSAEEVRKTLTFLRTLFPFRTCKMDIAVQEGNRVSEVVDEKSGAKSLRLDVICKDRDRPTPCIDYHIRQCIAPCIGTVTPAEYRAQCIDGVMSFFQGKYQDVEKVLLAQMQKAAADAKFERAAQLRDHLLTIRRTTEKQLVSDTSGADSDIIGAALLAGRAFIVLLKERGGKLIGEESFPLQGHADTIAEVLGEFLPQYYMEAADVPDVIIVGDVPEARESIEEWLKHLRGKRVALHVPERGKKSKLLLLAEKNADWKARQQEAKWEAEIRKRGDALTQLQSLLGLAEPPKRIEGYDISHMGGNETVASMVVFEHGQPKRAHYRSFNIRTVKKGNIDDYRSLQEALRRRLMYLVQSIKKEEKFWSEKGIVFAKARKADADFFISKLEGDTPVNEIVSTEFSVAREGDTIVAFLWAHAYAGSVIQLRSFWAEEQHRDDGKLEESMIRRYCATTKAKKLYSVIDTKEEERFARLGFRYVITPPDVLAASVSQTRIVVVFDSKEHKIDESFSTVPDLILIDGGKGQLSAVKQVVDELQLSVNVISIAKREEEIFVPGNSIPVIIPKEAPAQFLLQRVRDESHRFANDRRKRRAKSEAIRSALDEIPGVGGVMKQKLLAEFGSVDSIKSAPDEELLRVLTPEQVSSVREYFGG